MPLKSINNVKVTYNGTEITSYLNQASLQAVVNAIDTTVLNSSGMTKIPGLSDWTINVGGFWVKALHDVLNPDTVSPPSTLRTLIVEIGETGDTVTYTWTTNAFISNYQWTADPTTAIPWTGVLSVSGAPTMS